MLDTMDMPKLHLKKELSALSKSRFLKDPATSSSWKSPASNRSAPNAKSHQVYEGLPNGTKNSHSCEFEFNCSSRVDGGGKRVYLHNWRCQPAREGELSMASSYLSGFNSDKDGSLGIVSESPSSLIEDISKITIKNLGGKTSKMNMHGDSFSLLEMHLTTGYVDQFDNMGPCTSEELGFSMDTLLPYSGYNSRCESPLLSRWEIGSEASSFNGEKWSLSSRIMKGSRNRNDTCTPTSTCSNSRTGDMILNASTMESSDGMGFSDADEIHGMGLPPHGCGLPCYWSRGRKHRICKGCFSPSLSDTLRKRGSALFGRCGSGSRKERAVSELKCNVSLHDDLPLLTGGSENEFAELESDATSKMDKRKWSPCKRQESLQQVVSPGYRDNALYVENNVTLSQKYRPISFNEIIGQNFVVQSLINAVLREKIAPVYLFQGPHGIGKSSTARVLAAALNCLLVEGIKPCGSCRECADFASGRIGYLREVNSANKNDLDKVRNFLRNQSLGLPFPGFRVFVIDQCHMLPYALWVAFFKRIEDKPVRVVFIFITSEPDKLPRAIISRCQKYVFQKMKDTDIVNRLEKLAVAENLEFDLEALELIAMKSDGSLRDAEIMLEQSTLRGQRITVSLVNDLDGVIPDEKLLDLLDLALSSDNAETVKRARELIDSGADPVELMSQLATLIMDILAGSGSLTEAELEKLRQALNILSEAEKQLKASTDQCTWFTAALLQIGSNHCPTPMTQPGISPDNSKNLDQSVVIQSFSDGKVPSDLSKSGSLNGQAKLKPKVRDEIVVSNSHGEHASCHSEVVNYGSETSLSGIRCTNPSQLDEVWGLSVQGCYPITLRHMLHAHGKLVLISEEDGKIIAQIEFSHLDHKAIAERFLSSIAGSIEMVLKCNVEVRMHHLSANGGSKNSGPEESSVSGGKQMRIHGEESKVLGDVLIGSNSSSVTDEELRLESAWLQATEKCMPRVVDSLEREADFVRESEAFVDNPMVPEQAGVSADDDTSALQPHERGSYQRDRSKSSDCNGPSLSLLSKGNIEAGLENERGYESGPNSSGICCWKVSKPTQEKAKQNSGDRQRSGLNRNSGDCQKSGHSLWVIPCVKSKK
ncbi:hypothetical protein AMTRI_Chr01g134090 [Amborella trichopoda]